MNSNTGPVVHYGEHSLILRLKTQIPAHLHMSLLKGLIVSQKLALLAEDLTREEKDSILSLNEILSLLMPPEAVLEKVINIPEFQWKCHN